MKFSLKLFCIALISAGLVLSACERKPEATDEEAATEETEEVAEEEEAPAEEQADTGAEQPDAAAADQDASANADSGDTGEQAAAEQPQEKKAAKPQTPPVTGTLTGKVAGAGITDAELRLTVEDDYEVKGTFTGNREGARFVIPLQGSVSKKDNTVAVSGSRSGNTARLTGQVSKGGVSGTVKGKIHQNDYSTKFTTTK